MWAFERYPHAIDAARERKSEVAKTRLLQSGQFMPLTMGHKIQGQGALVIRNGRIQQGHSGRLLTLIFKLTGGYQPGRCTYFLFKAIAHTPEAGSE